MQPAYTRRDLLGIVTLRRTGFATSPELQLSYSGWFQIRLPRITVCPAYVEATAITDQSEMALAIELDQNLDWARRSLLF